MTDDEAGLADRVVRTGDDEIALRLTAAERSILEGLLEDLDAAIAAPAPDGPPADPVRRRLYPSAVPHDELADASFRRLVQADIEAGRRDRLGVVRATLDSATIDDGTADAWLHTLNDLRLVMGTRLEVTDETESRPLDPRDPDVAAKTVYAYTGWLLGQFVDVLAASLPDDGDGRPPVGPDDLVP
jgi:hypothetical protein